MDVNKEFWYTAYSPNKDLTDEMITKAEGILGLKLPQAFIDILLIQNGGETQGVVCPTSVKNSWAADHVPLDELYGIDFLAADAASSEGSEEEATETSEFNILDTPKFVKEWNLPEKQIVLCGDRNGCITLDYRTSETEPVVTWLDIEMKEDIPLANNFEAFLAGLIPFEKFGK